MSVRANLEFVNSQRKVSEAIQSAPPEVYDFPKISLDVVCWMAAMMTT